MSTRRLARTVVAGGRAGYSKYGRKEVARQNRRWKLDEEGEYAPPVVRDGWGREFADRLAPLRRWLESRVGRPWADVYSEFIRENNPRTMKGWHLHSHLAFDVKGAGFREMSGRYIGQRDFYLDEAGILRQWPRDPKGPYYAQRKEEAEADKWANGRKVMETDGVLYWAKRIVELPVLGPRGMFRDSPMDSVIVYRQSGRMSRADEAIWHSYSYRTRAGLSYFENE